MRRRDHYAFPEITPLAAKQSSPLPGDSLLRETLLFSCLINNGCWSSFCCADSACRPLDLQLGTPARRLSRRFACLANLPINRPQQLLGFSQRLGRFSVVAYRRFSALPESFSRSRPVSMPSQQSPLLTDQYSPAQRRSLQSNLLPPFFSYKHPKMGPSLPRSAGTKLRRMKQSSWA